MKFKEYLNEAGVKLPKNAKIFSHNTEGGRAAGFPSTTMAYVLPKDQNKHDGYNSLDDDEIMIYAQETTRGFWMKLYPMTKRKAAKEYNIKIK